MFRLKHQFIPSKRVKGRCCIVGNHIWYFQCNWKCVYTRFYINTFKEPSRDSIRRYRIKFAVDITTDSYHNKSKTTIIYSISSWTIFCLDYPQLRDWYIWIYHREKVSYLTEYYSSRNGTQDGNHDLDHDSASLRGYYTPLTSNGLLGGLHGKTIT